MCVDTLRTCLISLRQSIWGVTCWGLLSKWMFFHLSAWKPINVCWNPQNRAQFSEMMDLRDHMPRFTLKMNVFPSISLETPDKCVLIPLEQGSFFQDNQFEGSHIWGLLYKWNTNEHFPIYLLGNPINCVLKPSEQGLFLLRRLIWGITCLGLLSKWMFFHLSAWKPQKCVLKPSLQGLFLQDDWFEGSHV